MKSFFRVFSLHNYKGLPFFGEKTIDREGKMTQISGLSRPLKLIALATASGLVLAGCAATTEEPTATPTETTSTAEQPEASVGGNMVVGITIDPDTIHRVSVNNY